MRNPSHPRHQRRQDLGGTLVPFHGAHLDLLAWREFDDAYTRKLPTFTEQVEAFCEASMAVTVVADGRILACGGVLPVGSGIGYTWMFGSVYLREHSLWFVKELHNWLAVTAQTLGLHRLQTVCHVDDAQGIKWVESLGFVAEGTLRMYDALKGDYIMYARLTEQEGGQA